MEATLVHVEVSQHYIDKYGQQIMVSIDCPIFHAMQDAGLPVTYVHWGGFRLSDDLPWFEWPMSEDGPTQPISEWQRRATSRLAGLWGYDTSKLTPFSFDVNPQTGEVSNVEGL